MKVCLAVILVIILIACGVPQAEYDQLSQKVDSLQAELDAANIELAEFNSGPEMLLNEAKKYLAADNFEAAKLTLEALMIQHPTSPQASEANELFNAINTGQMNTTDTIIDK